MVSLLIILYKFCCTHNLIKYIYIYIYIYVCVCEAKLYFIDIDNTSRRSGCYSRVNRFIGLVGRVFANGPGGIGSIPGRVIPKT